MAVRYLHMHELTDGQRTELVQRALKYHLKTTATQGQIAAIVDYMREHDAVAFHAISRVLGGCCHCQPCLTGNKEPTS